MSCEIPSMESMISNLSKTLSELGDENPSQSTQPLKHQVTELQLHLKRLESSLQQSIESGKNGQEATANFLTRGNLIKHRLDELETQLDILDSGNTILEPESLKRRLEGVDNLIGQVSDFA